MHLFGCGFLLALLNLIVFSVFGSSVVSAKILQPMLQIGTVQLFCFLILMFKLANALRVRRGMQPYVVARYDIVEDKAATLALGMACVLWGVAVLVSFSRLDIGARIAIAAAYLWGVAEVCLNPLTVRDQSRFFAPALGLVINVPLLY